MKRRAFLGIAPASAAIVASLGRARAGDTNMRGTGDLGLIVERASGSVLIVDTSARRSIAVVEGLGDLSHASAVFSRDQRYTYVFGRDGGLSKIDLLEARIDKRVMQAGNAIGGAISDDGQLIAVANYEPGGVRIFDAETLAPVTEIASDTGTGTRSKVVGIADAPGRRFVFSLYDAGEIWIADCSEPAAPKVARLKNIGKLPYDGLITGDGRHYMAGLFGEDGLVHVDLWASEPEAKRVLGGYGRGEDKLPVYKMPHMRGWAQAGDRMLLPAIGRHEALVIDMRTFTEIGRVALHGQPVFIVARPDGRYAWVNFAHPLNDTLQVIDTQSLAIVHEMKPGPAVLHIEFTPRGHEVWVSVRDADRVDVFNTHTFAKVAELPCRKPSGILFSARAQRIGL